jgi:tetratricopeptide (TPR) repeat protein
VSAKRSVYQYADRYLRVNKAQDRSSVMGETIRKRVAASSLEDLELAKKAFMRAHDAGDADASYVLFLISSMKSTIKGRDPEAKAYLKAAVEMRQLEALEKLAEEMITTREETLVKAAHDLLVDAVVQGMPRANLLRGLYEMKRKEYGRALEHFEVAVLGG